LCNKVFVLTVQAGYALAVAEQVLEFEHRDLHWGNVLVSQTTEKNVAFKLCGKEYTVPTKGVQVSTQQLANQKMSQFSYVDA
jgi:serine/threonine-protein kinase haspin